MSNNIAAALSNTAFVPPTGIQERIFRDQKLLFRAVFNHKNPRRFGTIEK